MRFFIGLVVGVLLGSVTSAFAVPVLAQTDDSPSPTPVPTWVVAGRWILSFTVTKGNDAVRERVAKGMTMECAQNMTIVICETDNPGAPSIQGVVDGQSVVFDVDSQGPTKSTGVASCYWGYYGYTCVARQNERRDSMKTHWTGTFVNPTLIRGQWTGIMHIDGPLFSWHGDYPVEGTWTGIKII